MLNKNRIVVEAMVGLAEKQAQCQRTEERQKNPWEKHWQVGAEVQTIVSKPWETTSGSNAENERGKGRDSGSVF